MSEAAAAPAVAPDTSAPPSAPVAATPASPPSEKPATPKGARGSKVTPPPAEAKTDAPAADPPKPEKPKADEWARLTAAEKKARKERETLDAERRAFAEERKGLDSQRARIELLDKAKAGDWDARQALMKETGLSYDELTKRVLAGNKVDKGETALQRIERLEAELKERDEKAAQQTEAQAFKTTCDTFVSVVTKENPEAYPLLAGEIADDRPGVEAVIRELLAASAESGTTITYAEAAAKYEAHLRAQTERRAARLRPAPAAPAEAPKPSTETRPRDETGRFAGGDGPRRLTNRDSAERGSVPRSPDSPPRRMTQRERDLEERERIRRAAAAMPRRG